MCGIAGIVDLQQHELDGEVAVRRMLATIGHRGPDESGVYTDHSAALGSVRLSIIDLSTGQQPMCNEDGTRWIVFNGEIFNYRELRPQLEARGHRFRTRSDTEVLLHLFEEYGPRCLELLNGQFAFAVWDVRDHSLFLARDRLGVRPVFYTIAGGRLFFGSEIKALLANPSVTAEIDPAVLAQVFVFWGPLSPQTVFRGIAELPPGHYLEVREGAVTVRKYWELTFPGTGEWNPPRNRVGVEEQVRQLGELLIDAVRLRLRADVPVGAYLSGGLDSSLIATIIRRFTTNRLATFSIAFEDPDYDESAHQQQMARCLDTQHLVATVSHDEIAAALPDVIWHTEVPLMRTAPVPMFLLSRLVRDSGFKVVLTGEGADEFLGGYDIFKEAKIRRFWARSPNSQSRPSLLRRLYPDIPNLARTNGSFLAAFFREDLQSVETPDYSHAVRWRNNLRACRFFTGEVREQVAGVRALLLSQPLPERFGDWSPLARAQYWEIKVFMSQYLLSSQGDRVAMANSVEGRFPFLDTRVVQFCNQLPERLKLRALTEKFLLKKLGGKWLPPEISRRPKRPYRAPTARCFFNGAAREYVRELLSPEKLRVTGLFDPLAVQGLCRKAERMGALGETDEMALIGILSTQLLHHRFVANAAPIRPPDQERVVRVCSGTQTQFNNQTYGVQQNHPCP